MKKIIKIIGRVFLTIIVLAIGYSIYLYQTKPIIKTLLNNDESKLFYKPKTEMKSMLDLNYDEHILKVEDALKIYSYTFDSNINPKANIFLIRGNGGNISTNLDKIKPLVDNGFNVYSVDWRGYGKSNGIPGYKEIMNDTRVAYLDFLSKTKNDSIKTIVYGMSLGGLLAVKITEENQTTVDALILDGTLASAHSFIKDNINGYILQMLIKTPEEYNQDYMAIRDIAAIKDIPKLIIHSKKDRAVPFVRGKNVYDAAQEPKLFWETNTEHIETLTVLTNETMLKINELISIN